MEHFGIMFLGFIRNYFRWEKIVKKFFFSFDFKKLKMVFLKKHKKNLFLIEKSKKEIQSLIL